MKCKNCGAEVKEETRFCEVCGQPVEQAAPSAGSFTQQSSPAGYGMPPVSGEPKKKSKTPLFVCLAVLVAAVIGIVAFAMPMIKKSMLKPADYMQYVEQKSRDEGSKKVGQYFEMAKTSLGSSDNARKGTVQIEITDDVKSLIKSFLSGYATLYGIQIPDLSKLNDISVDVETDLKGDGSGFRYTLNLNGESILTANMYMDYAGKKVYYQIPELSPAYLDAAAAMQQESGSSEMFSMEYLQGLQSGAFLPDAKTAEKIFGRYTDILIHSIKNAEKQKDQTCEVEGISAKADVYTAKYEGKEAVALIKEFITALKEDDEVLSYVEKIGAEKKEIQSSLEDALKNSENLKGSMTFTDYVSKEEEVIGREIRLFESDDAKEPEMLIQFLSPKVNEKAGFLLNVEYKSEEIMKITGKGTISGDIFNGEFSAESPKLMESMGQMASGEVVHVKVSDYDMKKAETEGTGKYEITVPGIAQLSAFKLVMEVSGTVNDSKMKIDVNMGEQKLCTLNIMNSKGEALNMNAPGSGDTVYDVTKEDEITKYASEMKTEEVLEHVKEVSGIDLLPILRGSLDLSGL